jgi:predicted ArsR family transcriptional regulator
VLAFVVEHREVRVEELSEAMGISGAAVRRHLENLRADGLVDVHSVKQATGRPYYVFTPTERAIGGLSGVYETLLERILHGVDAQAGVTDSVASEMAATVAQRHRDEVAAARPGDRVQEVTVSLRAEGILESWHEERDGFHLVNGQCPYRKAAEVSKLPCESDRRTIELLLGQEVMQLNRIVDGAATCEYLVAAQQAAGQTTT